jgi:hypothetical protein
MLHGRKAVEKLSRKLENMAHVAQETSPAISNKILASNPQHCIYLMDWKPESAVGCKYRAMMEIDVAEDMNKVKR